MACQANDGCHAPRSNHQVAGASNRGLFADAALQPCALPSRRRSRATALARACQRGKIKDEAALRDAWKKQEEKEDKESVGSVGTWPWTMPLPCRGCSDAQKKLVEYPLGGFAFEPNGVKAAWKTIAAGQHLMCPKCARERGILAVDMFCEA